MFIELLDRLFNLRFPKMPHLVELGVRKELDGHDSSHFTPVRPIRTEPEHGTVVAHEPSGSSNGSGGKDLVVDGEALSSNLPAAHNQGSVQPELYREYFPILVGHAGEGLVGELTAVEKVEVADDGPAAPSLWRRWRPGIAWPLRLVGLVECGYAS